jgi:hypothetical protein
MLFFDSNAFRVTAIIFILLTIFIAIIQPPIFFDPDGNLKSFSMDYTEETTPVPFVFFIYTLLVVIYLIVLFIDLKISQILPKSLT